MRDIQLLVTALVISIPGVAGAQNQGPSGYVVPLPQGMPRLPPGAVVGAGGRPRRVIIQTAPAEPGRHGADRSDEGGGNDNTYEIYGNSSIRRFAVVGGPKPTEHIVRPGDTLWDICETYFQDPWLWPKIWALNPEITNPHWIYPGDRIKLRRAGRVQRRPTAAAFGEVTFRSGQPTGDVWLKLKGFLSEEKIKKSGVIKGAFSERIMLTTGDVIYVQFKKGHPLEVGKRYSIYEPLETVRHPFNNRRIGRMVRLDADVEIDKVTLHGKTGIARGRILHAVNPVERGYLVGPLRKKLASVDIRTNRKIRKLEAVVVAILSEHDIVGAHQVVFLDKGSAEGMEPGFVLQAYRRGDLYRRTMEAEARPGRHYWPAEVFGQLVVMRTSKHHSIALVVHTRREIRVGTLVKLRYEGPSETNANRTNARSNRARTK